MSPGYLFDLLGQENSKGASLTFAADQPDFSRELFTIAKVKESHSQVPWPFLVLKNRSKMCVGDSSDMPQPLSLGSSSGMKLK
jgi:hypothetical protein